MDTGCGRRQRKRARKEKNFAKDTKMTWPCPKCLLEAVERSIPPYTILGRHAKPVELATAFFAYS